MTNIDLLSPITPPPVNTPSQTGSHAQSRAEKVAQEFEALVLSQLLAPIFSSVESSSLTSAGPGEDAFETMLQDHYAKTIAARGGIGIADQVKASLIALQAEAGTKITETSQLSSPSSLQGLSDYE